MNKVVSIFKVLLMEFLCSAVLLALVALLMYKAGIDQSVTIILVGVVYFVTTFVGGLVMGKAQREKRLIWGIAMGILYIAILMLIAVLIKSELVGSHQLVVCIACSIFGGALGGMFS